MPHLPSFAALVPARAQARISPRPTDQRFARRRIARRLRAWSWRARPYLVGLLVAFAVALGFRALTPAPTAMVEVLTASRLIAAGETIAPGMLRPTAFPSAFAPADALSPSDAVDGTMISLSVPEGAVLTRSHLASAGWGLREGEVALPVQFADPASGGIAAGSGQLWLIRATGDGAEVLCRSARVLAHLPASEASDGGLGGLAGTRQSSLVLVAVPQGDLERVADASSAGVLTLALGP